MEYCEKCMTCVYCGHLGGSTTTERICQYILVTGHMRGCPAGNECIRYKKGERSKTKDESNYNKAL